MKITKSSIRTIVRRTLKEADTKYDWQKAPGRDAYSWAKDVPTAKPGASMMDAGDLLHAVADSVKKTGQISPALLANCAEMFDGSEASDVIDVYAGLLKAGLSGPQAKDVAIDIFYQD